MAHDILLETDVRLGLLFAKNFLSIAHVCKYF